MLYVITAIKYKFLNLNINHVVVSLGTYYLLEVFQVTDVHGRRKTGRHASLETLIFVTRYLLHTMQCCDSYLNNKARGITAYPSSLPTFPMLRAYQLQHTNHVFPIAHFFSLHPPSLSPYQYVMSLNRIVVLLFDLPCQRMVVKERQ